MLSRRASSTKWAQFRRAMLSPLAEQHGLSYNDELFDPGDRPEQIAYGLVSAGAQLPLSMTWEFPSASRRVRKRGLRLVQRAVQMPEGEDAAVLGAHVLALLATELSRAIRDEHDAEVHLAQRDLISRYYPLSDDLVRPVEDACAEYRTLDQLVVRREVELGAETGTGFHMALMDGQDPSRDPELVEVQRLYAGAYLRNHGLLATLRVLVGAEAFDGMYSDLLRPGTVDPAFIRWDLGLQRAYVDWMDDWAAVVNRAPWPGE